MATAAETDGLLLASTAAAAETDGLLSSGKQSTTKTQPKKAEETDEIVGTIICAVLLVYVVLILTVVAVGLVYLFGGGGARDSCRPYDPVEYTVTIAAVYGLDHAAKDDLRQQQQHPASSASATAATLRVIDVAFNLTVAVASPRTAERRECVQAGTTVQVSYLRSGGGVPVATGRAPAFCVEVGERREEGSVVAWGDGVRLPGFVLDSLAADMLHGRAPEFGIKLVAPVPYCTGGGQRSCSADVDVISCWAKAGGSPAPCSVSTRTVSVPLLPRLGSTTRVLDF